MINVKFDFIPQGAVISESEKGKWFIYTDGKNCSTSWDSSKTVVVDTGNKLKQGIIDHHQPGSENASVASIIANDAPRYLNHLSGQNYITIVTHFEPDLDAIASCYLVQKFLKEGAMSDLDRLFATYVNEVDSGKLTMDPCYPHTVAAVVNAINAEISNIDRSQKSHKILDEGLRFIEEVYRLLESDQNLWGDHFLDNMNGFETYHNKIKDDVKIYYEDFKERSEIDSMYLLNRETNVYEQVDFILTKNPKSVLWKYWVRGDTLNSPMGDGFIFTCALYDFADRQRAIISTDPTTPYNLKGLGILLDSLEIEELIKVGNEIVNKPRPGFCRENPWYDGSGGHNYTIVDAPRGYSILTGDNIICAIKANELWLKIGEDIDNGSFDRLNFDAVKELPHPISYGKIDEKAIQYFIEADIEEKQNLIANLKSATEKLQYLSPASEFEKLKRDTLRNRLFQSLIQYYAALPSKLKYTVVSGITDVLIDTFPNSYLQDWVLHTSKLPAEPLRKLLERALPFIAPKERFIYLMHVRDRHEVNRLKTSKQLAVSNPDVLQSIIEFYNTFDIPSTPFEEFEETPLFLVHNGILHFEDILIYSFLSDELSTSKFPTQLSINTDNLTITEVDCFQSKIKEVLNNTIIQRYFGDNYNGLRNSRNSLLNAGIVNGADLIKRYSISRITKLNYSELKDLINKIFSGVDLHIEEVSAYQKQLLFLKSIRRFEFLLDRYYVFLRLSALLHQVDAMKVIPGFLKESPELIPLLHLFQGMYLTSTAFMWHDDKKQTIDELIKTTKALIHLKSQNLPLKGIYSLLDNLYTFYTHMAEELEIDISQTSKKIQLCFNQHEYLRIDGELFDSISNLPAYFRHILHEVLLSYRRLYQDKIYYLQNELQQVVETDSSSADDNNLYVNFCSEILFKSIVNDWKDYRQKVLQENNLNLKKSFFNKYFAWLHMTLDSYQEKSQEQKKQISKFNSKIRFAASKGGKDIKRIIDSLPDPLEYKNVNEGDLNLLIYQKDFVSKAGFIPLNMYYDTYDYLSERYIDTFDIENVAKSISSFSTKFPTYIRWFSNTNFLRGCVMVFITLLFLMGAFDPNIYEYAGEEYRPPLPQLILSLLGDKQFNIISGILVAFWSSLLGIAFMIPVVFVLYKILFSSYKSFQKGEVDSLSFIKNIKRIEGKQSRLLYLSFLIPLVLIIMQMANPETFSMISEFHGLRLFSSGIIIFLLTIYSIYLDVEQKNPKKPASWITSRTKHMFWLYSLQALVLTVFAIDFLLRFQLTAEDFSTPQELISLGISRFIVLEFKWFNIVLMPLFTIIISFLTLFFSFFVNRVFSR
jgi:hypothetical protein